MYSFKLKTPVAFIIFNRPDTTTRVFAEIAKAKPPKLLVVGDGPRVNRPGEAEKVAAARAIIKRVDWDCEVLTNFSEVNLGCKRRVSSGLDWVFDTVEEAIILEDDCLPHPTFFRFCEELLEKYRHDERIAQIGGVNFQFGLRRTEDSYYFSRFNHIWGWASWRRTWSKHYDVDLKKWPDVRVGGWLADILDNRHEAKYWEKIFQSVYEGKIDTWDYQWTFACWVNSALTILPNVNLISNIGFGPEATHTKGLSRLANMPLDAMTFSLRHPDLIIRNAVADSFSQENHFIQGTLVRRILNRVVSELARLRQQRV